MKSFLPKEWWIHQADYKHYDGMDDFGSDSYLDPHTIDYCRFDNSTVYSRDTQANRIQANGVLFVCAIRNSYLPELTERSKVVVNGKEYTIQKVIELPFPTSDDIHHYELEVV